MDYVGYKKNKKGKNSGTCDRGLKIVNELENFSGVNVTVLCLAGGCGIQKRAKEHNGFCHPITKPILLHLFLLSVLSSSGHPPVTEMQRTVILLICSSTFSH